MSSHVPTTSPLFFFQTMVRELTADLEAHRVINADHARQAHLLQEDNNMLTETVTDYYKTICDGEEVRQAFLVQTEQLNATSKILQGMLGVSAVDLRAAEAAWFATEVCSFTQARVHPVVAVFQSTNTDN
jgi:hypothetical protein